MKEERMTDSFRRTYPSAQPVAGTTEWFLFQGPKVLVFDDGVSLRPLEGGLELLEAFAHEEPVYLGSIGDLPCVACAVAEGALPLGVPAWGDALLALFG